MSESRLTTGQCAALASVLEVTAPKPGNVHRGADFEDLSYPDFVVSAIAMGPSFDRVAELSVGQIVLQAVQATRQLTGTNTNLGIILLLAPLAKVPLSEPLTIGIQAILANLTAADAADVYAAIRHAQPGGLGTVSEADVAGPAPADLLVAMRLAADRDLIARQYAGGFHHVLTGIVPWLTAAVHEKQWSLSDAIVHTYLQMLAAEPDSLIARKCGPELASNTSLRAAKVLSCGEPGNPSYHEAVADFDFWLRSDHHRRNPGTTADLIAAGLFACLRDGIIKAPFDLTNHES
jgi:triphosphoribosyl-dephospho-CoA synthase